MLAVIFLALPFLVWEELRSTSPPKKTHTHTQKPEPAADQSNQQDNQRPVIRGGNSVLPLWSPQPVASCRVRLLRLREDDHVWQVHVVWMWKWDLPSFKAQSGRGGGDILSKKWGHMSLDCFGDWIWLIWVFVSLLSLDSCSIWEALWIYRDPNWTKSNGLHEFGGLTGGILGRRGNFPTWSVRAEPVNFFPGSLTFT